MVCVMHRSGTAVLRTPDTVIIRRGEGADARRVADLIEKLLHGSGFDLIAGGVPDCTVSLYRAPRKG